MNQFSSTNSEPMIPCGLTPAQAERLALVAEECSEVIQVITKILRHGYQAHGHNNRIALEHELGDLTWAVGLMAAADDLWPSSIARFAAEKPEKAEVWLHHNDAWSGTTSRKEGFDGA